jgi:hypothetical protein
VKEFIMASISYDFELMTNYVEAVNVPAASHMSMCLHGSSQQPVVFALSDHEVPKLQAIYVSKAFAFQTFYLLLHTDGDAGQ